MDGFGIDVVSHMFLKPDQLQILYFTWAKLTQINLWIDLAKPDLQLVSSMFIKIIDTFGPDREMLGV